MALGLFAFIKNVAGHLSRLTFIQYAAIVPEHAKWKSKVRNWIAFKDKKQTIEEFHQGRIVYEGWDEVHNLKMYRIRLEKNITDSI